MGDVFVGRVTEEEFAALPESLDKVELVDGEIIVTPSPSFAHQLIVQRLIMALTRWAERREGSLTIAQAPLDVRLGSGRIVQPDVFVIFERVPFDHQGPLDHVPELCVEVVSGNRAHDRVTKRFLYAAAGVKEYWVVDPAGIFERWTGPAMDAGQALQDVVATPLLLGFELELSALFARE